MPAITLGLAEVEERLRAVRRRLNSVTAQHSAYLAGSAVVLLSTAVIVAGLRASASTFRLVLGASTLLVLVALCLCGAYARRRWLTLEQTAYLADARAQLTDRLATLIDLRLHPRSSRLAPLLVSQALGLGERWQPRHLAPRLIPRSIVILFASVLGLAATTFIERHVAPPPPSASISASAAGAKTAAMPDSGAPAQAHRRTEATTAAQGQPNDAGQGEGAWSARGNDPRGGSDAGNGQDGSDASTASARNTTELSLTDRLQENIRHTFRAAGPEQPAQLTARSSRDSGHEPGSKAERQPQSHGDSGPLGAGPQNPSGTKAEQRSGQSPSGKSGAKGQSGSNAPQSFQGSSPGAGSGSSPQGLMDPNAPAPAGSEQQGQRFTVAITSLVRPVPQAGKQGKRAAPRSGAAQPSASGSEHQTALSEQQLPDDPLRKPEVPPEYEDLVRRVYSSRGEQ